MRKFYNSYKYQMVNLLAHCVFFGYVLTLGWWYLLVGVVVGWVVHNFSHSFYIHRVRAHNHFVLSDTWHWIGLTLFTMTNLGSPPVYVAVHMKHHTNSGGENDPHDPYHLGFFRMIFGLWDGWFTPDRRFLAIMMKDPKMVFFHKHHLTVAVISAIMFPFIVVSAMWLSKIPIGIVHLKNVGYGIPANKTDTSKNVPWLKPITWGEELHNNHHRYAGTANHNIKGTFSEIDFLYWFGKLIEKKP